MSAGLMSGGARPRLALPSTFLSALNAATIVATIAAAEASGS